MANFVLEQCDTIDETVKAAEIQKPLIIIITVAKPVFPHHICEQGVVKAHLGIQIASNIMPPVGNLSWTIFICS